MTIRFRRILFETFLIGLLFLVPAYAQSLLDNKPPLSSREEKNVRPEPGSPVGSVRLDEIIENAETYNREAVRLFEEGRYEEAQELWEKAIKTIEGSEPAGGVVLQGGEIVSAEVAATLDQDYQSGLAFFAKKEYAQARDAFMRVKAVMSGYKDTENYLFIIDNVIRGKDGAGNRRTKKVPAPGQTETEAVGPQDEDEQFRQSVEASEKRRRKDIQAQTETTYQRAVEAYKRRQFDLARTDFQEVAYLYPDYKLTNQYLDRIEKDTQREKEEYVAGGQGERESSGKRRQEEFDTALEGSRKIHQDRLREEAEIVYQKGRASYENLDYEKAWFYFQEVEQILPGYKSTAKFLERIAGDITREERRRLEIDSRQRSLVRLKEGKEARLGSRGQRQSYESQERSLALQAGVDVLYEEARECYRKRDFRKARQLFQKVNETAADYQSTGLFLARIDEDIRREEEYQKARQKREYDLQMQEKMFLQRGEKGEDISLRQRGQEKLRTMRERIEKEQKARQEKQAASLYKEAQSYYKGNSLDMAEGLFKEVQKVYPGYKATEKYLARIADAKKREQDRRKKDELKKAEAERHPPVTAKGEKKKEMISASKTSGGEQLVVQKAEKERRLRLQQEAKAGYAQAMKHYASRDFAGAKQKFIEVEALCPGYKATRHYLSRIDEDIEQKKSKVSQGEGKPQDVPSAVTAPAPVRPSAAEGGGQAAPLKSSQPIPTPLDDLRLKRGKIQGAIQARLEETYKKAVELYEQGSYAEAGRLFAEIKDASPGYKRAESYIVNIQRKTADRPRRADGQEESVLYQKGGGGGRERLGAITHALDTLERGK